MPVYDSNLNEHIWLNHFKSPYIFDKNHFYEYNKL